jgi:hypothetical protein
MPFRSVEDLTARCSTRIDSLERLAWAGALDGLVEGGRREALWRLGVAAPGVRVPDGTQLALPVDVEAPELDQLTPWERLLADYGSTNVTLREHPIGLMRPSLADDVLHHQIGPGAAEAELRARGRLGEGVDAAVVGRQAGSDTSAHRRNGRITRSAAGPRRAPGRDPGRRAGGSGARRSARPCRGCC